MSLIKGKEWKALKEMGFEPITEQSVIAMGIIIGTRIHYGFWDNIDNFKIGVMIATKDLGCNSTVAIRFDKNNKYRRIDKAFNKNRNIWWPDEKVSWKNALKRLGIPIVIRNNISKENEAKAKKELEEIGFIITEKTIAVMAAIIGKGPAPSGFFADLENFKIGVMIATKDLGTNSAEALNKKKNGKYLKLRRAFDRYRKTWWPGKDMKWRKALKSLQIEFKPDNTGWDKEKLITYMKENNIFSHAGLKDHPDAFAHYSRNAKEYGSIENLIRTAGLKPVNAVKRANQKKATKDMAKHSREEIKNRRDARIEKRKARRLARIEERKNRPRDIELEALLEKQRKCEHDSAYRNQHKCRKCGKERR